MNPSYREHLIQGQQAGMRYALRIPREAMRGATGFQLGRETGSSLDFKDYREYQPGDDIRGIDWGVYARSDKLIIKLYHEEVSPHVDLVIDGSASMDLAGSMKLQTALGLCGVLVSAATNAKCSHAAWITGEGCRRVANGTAEPAIWEGLGFDATTSLAAACARMPPDLHAHGMRVLISDLFMPDDPLTVLRPLADKAAGLVVIQLLAREDADPRLLGNVRLADSETGETRDVFVDAVEQRRYRHALARHQQNWNQACRQVGATMLPIIAEEMIESGWRLDAFQAANILGAA